jgi:hypothetical protein
MIQFNDLTPKSLLRDLADEEAINTLGGFSGSGMFTAPSESPDRTSEMAIDSIFRSRVDTLLRLRADTLLLEQTALRQLAQQLKYVL